jgi:peptide/nickel transport system ATP-binding protein
MDTVLDIRRLCIAYETEGKSLPAVRDVSLGIAGRQSYGLVGESGSGKTTLALGAIRYLAENGRITAGEVFFEGRNLLELPAREVRSVRGNRVGMVYQSPSTALNPSIRVGSQVAEVARRHLHMGKAEARERALHMLEQVAMPDPEAVVRRYPHQLSGGMLQRCVIAMALITDPRLLIMDEPTTALDVTTQAVVLDLVAELKSRLDAAILYITHDLAVVARVCDRVGVLYAGEMVEEADLRTLFSRPRHPYTLALLGCIPRYRVDGRRGRLLTIPGRIPHLDELPSGCVFAPRCPLAEEACRASRPPLREIGEGHLSACRRFTAVPTPAAYVEDIESAVDWEAVSLGEERLLEAHDVEQHFPMRGNLFAGKARRKAVRAVDGVTLYVNRGRTLGVVGESGSGKTTLARALIGLEAPTAGRVLFEGEALGGTTARRSRTVLKNIQMVFQDPDASLNPRHPVGEAISRPLYLLRGVRGAELRRKVRELLAAVNLPAAYAERLPGELSGGEKQRVAVARAFAAEPKLVLCDEPLSSLDVSVQGSLMNLLHDLQVEQKTAYFFISHDLAAVQHLSDWIAVMYLGKVVELGDALQVLNPPYHPYTEALLSAVPVPDPGVRQSTIRLEGAVPSPLDVPPGCRFHTRCPRVLGDICRTQEPPWQEGPGSHWLCCHIPCSELEALQGPCLLSVCLEDEGG